MLLVYLYIFNREIAMAKSVSIYINLPLTKNIAFSSTPPGVSIGVISISTKRLSAQHKQKIYLVHLQKHICFTSIAGSTRRDVPKRILMVGFSHISVPYCIPNTFNSYCIIFPQTFRLAASETLIVAVEAACGRHVRLSVHPDLPDNPLAFL